MVNILYSDTEALTQAIVWAKSNKSKCIIYNFGNGKYFIQDFYLPDVYDEYILHETENFEFNL